MYIYIYTYIYIYIYIYIPNRSTRWPGPSLHISPWLNTYWDCTVPFAYYSFSSKLRMPPTIPINHYLGSRNQQNRTEVLSYYSMLNSILH